MHNDINMEENKYCCFTGHRPNKLYADKDEIIKRLDSEIESAIQKGFNSFISGMAPGVDVWAAQRVISFKSKYDVNLVCAMPFPRFCEKRVDSTVCSKILSNADIIENISSHYYPSVFQVRNEWMVDRSGLVIAAYNGTKGGTKNTVAYAVRKNVRVINILYPDTFSI